MGWYRVHHHLWDDTGLPCHLWDDTGYPITYGMIQGPPSLMGWYRVYHHLWDDAVSTITYGMIQGLPSLMGWYRGLLRFFFKSRVGKKIVTSSCGKISVNLYWRNSRWKLNPNSKNIQMLPVPNWWFELCCILIILTKLELLVVF